MKSFFKTDKLAPGSLFFLLVTLLVCSFYPLLSKDPITTYDDTLIIGGLENLHSLSEYKDRFLAGKVLDIQPVRDLSYLIDLKIKSISSLHSFHLSNLLLWIVICFFFKKILDEIDKKSENNQWLIWSFVFVYAMGPVFSTSVAWISGRKHLLSAFFIVSATLLFLKGRHFTLNAKSTFSIASLYLLAVFSQPINILWPAFVFVWSYCEKKVIERKYLLSILTTIAILALVSNLYYYQTLYEAISGGDGKYDSNFGLGLSLLALGRYFYLTLFPFNSLPVSHYQGAWENIIGLTLLFSFLFYLYKKKTENYFVFCFVLYFFLPLIPVTYKITRIFCSDTYVLNASIGLYVVFFLLLKNIRSKYLMAGIFFYAAILYCINLSYVQVFMTSENIFKYSYKKEPTPMSIASVADILLRENNFSEAKNVIDQLEIMEPDNRFFSKLKSDLIYNNQNISDEEKIKGLEQIAPKTPIVFLRLALLYSNNGKALEFQTNTIKIFSDPQAYIRNSYLRNEEMLALVRVACEVNKVEDICKKQYDEFSKSVRFNDWRPEVYKNIYYELKTHSHNLFYK